jgi:serine/threonine protein kinase
LDASHNIKIGDFGMAQLMKGENNLLKTSCGSPHYASPEIIEGGTYDGTRTDVWSMGVILYALITGSLPFDDENLGTLLDLVRRGQYSTPSFVPKDIADLISKMLTVDPAKRIPIAHIKFHPCFQTGPYFPSTFRHSPNFGSVHPVSAPASPVHSSMSVVPLTVLDEAVLADLESLGWGTKNELRHLLLNDLSTSLHFLPHCDGILRNRLVVCIWLLTHFRLYACCL